MNSLKVCTRCIYDERVASINFDENGVCNYCHQLENLKNDYGTATTKGEKQFIKIIDYIYFFHSI